MTTRSKQCILVIVAQMLCLGVGLWMHGRYVGSTVSQAAEEQTWSDMKVCAEEWFSNPVSSASATQATRGEDVEHPPAPTGASSPSLNNACSELSTVIVDARWRVVAFGRAETNPPPLSPGTRLSWTRLAATAEDSDNAMRGMLSLPSGPHFALAYPLRDQNGYVLVHRSRAAVEALPAALLQSLPAIGGITFLWISALLAVAIYMTLARFHEAVERDRTRTDAETLRQAQDLVRTRDAVIFGLAKLADSRDPETGAHLERISMYSTTITAELQRNPRSNRQITPAFSRLIGISSALHDIGKVGIEDRILLKPGPLTAEERGRMQTHAAIGGECLRGIERRLGGSNFLQMAREIAFAHHERWDGTGYPNGLREEAIPLAARIVAIADVYDALSSKRVYKDALPHEVCVETIRSEAGKHFDPELVEVWLTIESKFRDVARRYARKTTDVPRDSAVKPRSAPKRAPDHESKTLVSSPAQA